MHQNGFLLLLLLLYYPCRVIGQHNFSVPPKQNTQLTATRWLQDIHYLYDSLQKYHANLFHYHPKKVFEKKIHQITSESDRLNSYQFFVRLKQLVALAGDGHTFVADPHHYHSYPLTFFHFPEGVRLVKADRAYANLLGQKLVAINHVPVKRVLDSLNTLVAQGESSTFPLKERATMLVNAEYLYAFNISSSINSASFVFEQDGRRTTVTVTSKERTQLVDWTSAYKPLPLFLQKEDAPLSTPLWWEQLNKQVFYFNFRGYADWPEMQQLCDSMYKQLVNTPDIRKVIIDMRRNGGGNFDKGLRIVLPVFLNLKALRPEISYYVVAGRETFSAGMANAIHLRDGLDATVVGEPTGARPNGYQELGGLVLPHSQIAVGLSTIYYTFQKQNTNGVIPDILIMPSFSLYATGRDPVIEKILAMPWHKKKCRPRM